MAPDVALPTHARARVAAMRAARPELRHRVTRTLLLAGAWGLLVGPTVAGASRCPVASVFHRPCPGCGMTRAVGLLVVGQWRASVHMHPLAVPMLLSGGALVLSTLWTTLSSGYPWVHKSVLGRAALVALGLIYVASIVLWVLRWVGFFGGPVPVG